MYDNTPSPFHLDRFGATYGGESPVASFTRAASTCIGWTSRTQLRGWQTVVGGGHLPQLPGEKERDTCSVIRRRPVDVTRSPPAGARPRPASSTGSRLSVSPRARYRLPRVSELRPPWSLLCAAYRPVIFRSENVAGRAGLLRSRLPECVLIRIRDSFAGIGGRSTLWPG